VNGRRCRAVSPDAAVRREELSVIAGRPGLKLLKPGAGTAKVSFGGSTITASAGGFLLF
jgi:hypothetical protein